MNVSYRFFVVPHTHWDREWYRPFEHFRLLLAHVVDGVIDVLERDPGFSSFTLDGQAIVLEDYLEVRPENESRLHSLLSSGRIEVGPSYILPDEFLVGGEPLVRNLLMGRAVCRRFGAEPSPVGYLPDSFGHPAQLPQILSGFGIGSFIFSRGIGDQLDLVFRWRSPDGSEVLAFQQLPSYGNFAGVGDVDEGERRVRAILEPFGSALDRAGVDAVLLCNGEDHAPVTPELPRLCEALEERVPGSTFTIARFADYVEAVGQVDVPAFTGEMLGSRLWNILRGVNSARLYVKRANEQAEQRLLAVETLASLLGIRDATPFPHADFALAWRELLRCHPHDTICGCSCDEVHRDAIARYESLQRTLSVLQAMALGDLTAGGASVGVINPLPFRRRRVIEPAGREPSVVELDGFSARTVETVPLVSGRPLEASSIESDRFRVEAASDASLTLIDKRTGRRFEGLHALEDEFDMGDLYNFCPVPDAGIWRSERATVRVLADGPAVSELEVRVTADRPSGLDDETNRPVAETASVTVATVVRLVRGSGRVEFRTTIDNAARDHRLRAVFPAGRVDGVVRAEGQFAVVDRPIEPQPPQTDWVEPPDPTQHTLGAVAVGPLALITKGLPEYEARESGLGTDLCLTLLRCVGVISKPTGALTTRPLGAGPGVATPEGQCLGRGECEYALVPDADRLDDLELLRESQDYRCGFVVVPEPVRFVAPLALEGDVIFSCLKGAEDGDGWVLRCFNPADEQTTATVVTELAVSQTRLDETGEQPLADGVLTLNAGEIGTLRLREVTQV